MAVVVESGIEIDFTAAAAVLRHDGVGPGCDGNTTWKGIDFRVDDTGRWLWVEVKSWDPAIVLPPRRRGGAQRSFVAKMKSKPFADEMRGKFWGTTAFLSWTARFTPSDVVFVLLFQPPRPLDKALLGTFQTRMQSLVPRTIPWTHSLTVAVMDVADWNARFPTYAARVM